MVFEARFEGKPWGGGGTPTKLLCRWKEIWSRSLDKTGPGTSAVEGLLFYRNTLRTRSSLSQAGGWYYRTPVFTCCRLPCSDDCIRSSSGASFAHVTIRSNKSITFIPFSLRCDWVRFSVAQGANIRHDKNKTNVYSHDERRR